MATTITTLASDELQKARDGSWYTILGAGGDLQEWTVGLQKMFDERGLGTPAGWYQTTGLAINHYAGTKPGGDDAFPEDLTVLLFDWAGMDMGKLALFKIGMEDRWFDDIIDNIRQDA